MTDMPTGLIRRGAAYSLRRRIPLDLIDAYGGRKEIVLALGTNDFAEAKLRLAHKQVELNDEFAARRQQRDADPASLITRTIAELRPFLAKPGNGTSYSDAEIDRQIEEAERSFREQFEAEQEREGRELLRQQLLAVLTVANDRLTDEQLALKDLLQDAKWEVELAEAALASRPLAAKAPPVETTAFDPGSFKADGTSWEKLVVAWTRDRSPEKRTVAAHSAVARWFADRTKATTAEEATPDHVRLFRTRLIEEGQSPANIKTKLSRLRTLFGYALEEGLITTNPAAVVRPPADKRTDASRVPWTAADLNVLFAGPVHFSGERPTQGRGEAAYWLPLLALFTGARLEELGQLRIIDLIDEVYPTEGEAFSQAKFIHIRSDAGDGLKVKNAGSVRKVPVHSDLIRSGFLRFVEHQKTLGHERLFSDLKPDKYERLTAKWGEWFGRYRKECGISHKGLVFHSFRHTFKHWARHVGIIEGVQRQIMGHSAKDVADGYGDGYSLHQVVEGMRLYRVPGFKPPIHPVFSQPEAEI